MADPENGATTKGNGAAAPEPPPERPSEPPRGGEETADLKAQLTRFGEILARGLDLAEAGMSLGVTIVSTVGAAAQQKIFEQMTEAVSGAAPVPPAAPAAASPAAPPPAAEPPAYGITNRLPVVPGSPASISFSINNDSPDAPRSVSLRVEGFVGQQTGTLLAADVFTVAPPSAVITPMDFEKFVLKGTIPPGTVPDIYHGSVLVDSETSISIPVWIVVQMDTEG
jgi:hypothetical protein